MSIDFFYAFTLGWSILLFFWIIILLFVFIRKPPNSKLTLKLTISSLLVFLLGYLFIYLFS